MRDLSDRELQRVFELDDAPGPARLVDGRRAAAIVAGALDGAGFPPAGGGGGGGGASTKHVSATSAAKGGAAIKLAILAGGAAVAMTAVAWLALGTREPAPAVAAPVVAPPASVSDVVAIAPLPAPAEPRAEREPTPPPASAPEPVEPLPAAPEPSPPTTPARPAKHGKPPRAHLRRAPAPAEPIADDDLLAEANAARVAHRWRDADALYSRVVAGGRGDLAVQAALVASASLRLEHLGDPAGAARRFRAALAAGPRDSLAEDARWGLVEAARAVADPAAELRALDDFLAHHAGSARAVRARARRAELGASP